MRLKIIKGPSFEKIDRSLFHDSEGGPLVFTIETLNKQRKKLGLSPDETTMNLYVFPNGFRWLVRDKTCDITGKINGGMLTDKPCQIEVYGPSGVANLGLGELVLWF